MRCFLINLNKDTERLDFMKRQLETLGIDFERFEAVDINNFSTKEVEEFSEIYYNGKKFTPGEIGCALSHKKIYKKMTDESIEEALILEDDIIFDIEKFKELFGNISKNSKWEYVSVNYDIFDKNFRSYFFKSHKKTKLIRKWLLILGMYLYIPFEFLQQVLGRFFGPIILFSPRPLHLSGAYFLRKSGADKLLSISEKIICPADYLQNLAQEKKGLRLFFVSPQIVRQYREKFGSSTR